MLGLAHAKSRFDVAVINGRIQGYEIESAKNTLDRLATQIDIYRQTLQKLTIVAASKHVAGIVNRAQLGFDLIPAERVAPIVRSASKRLPALK
jgi:hypothetical protein